MLARIRKAEQNEGGFTLIELLVVIIIIGILAAIAIPTFLKQREKGYISAAKADLKNAATAQESFATDNNGAYAGAGTAIADAKVGVLKDQGFNGTTEVTVAATAINTGGSRFQLCATHSQLATTRVYVYSSLTGAITGPVNACPTLS